MAVNAWILEHHTLLDSQPFERAMHYGLLEYQRRLTEQTVDMSGAAANHFKMVGATELVHVLRNLAEPPRPQTTPVSGNLRHDL